MTILGSRFTLYAAEKSADKQTMGQDMINIASIKICFVEQFIQFHLEPLIFFTKVKINEKL